MPLFTHTCTIQRHDGSVNALNELDPAGWADQLTAVSCRFKDNTQREPSPQNAQVMLSSYLMLLPASTAVLATDRISSVTTPDGTETGSFIIREGPYKRRDGRGQIRHIALGLERVEMTA